MQPLVRDRAEAIALQGLVWLTAREDLLPVFLGWSGMDPDSFRERIRDPEMLLAVLDFILLEDATVLALAQDLELPPETIMRARAGLPGGDIYHWT